MRMIADRTRFSITREDAMGDAREGVPWDELLVHGKFVRSLALALVNDASLAEDVAQATWLAAAEQPPADRGRVVGGLRTVATNFARQWRRSDSRRRGREVTAALGEALPSAELPRRVWKHSARRRMRSGAEDNTARRSCCDSG
jgi:DNA-directed RNA polymerase specialized sigma24 family protein